MEIVFTDDRHLEGEGFVRPLDRTLRREKQKTLWLRDIREIHEL